MLLIPDTNFFLHFEFFDGVKYTEVAGAPVTALVLCPCVLRELEKLKALSSEREIHTRADNVVKGLKRVLGASGLLKDGTRLLFVDEEPSVDFSAYRLEREVADDYLIASALSLQSQKLENRVLLLSNDTGVFLKAKSRRLECIDPEGRVTRRERKDSTSKRETELLGKVEHLKKHIALLEEQWPSVYLVFSSSNSPTFDHRARYASPFETSDLQEASEYLEKKYKRIDYVLPGVPGSPTCSQRAIDCFNSERAEFFKLVKEFLVGAHKPNNFERLGRLIPVSLTLGNNGRVPAHDIDVSLDVPRDLIVHTKCPPIPALPKPPSNPLHARVHDNSLAGIVRTQLPDLNRHGPAAEGENTVSYWTKYLKHGTSEILSDFFIEIPSGRHAFELTIGYRITIANHPQAQEGVLTINVDSCVAKPDWRGLLSVLGS